MTSKISVNRPKNQYLTKEVDHWFGQFVLIGLVEFGLVWFGWFQFGYLGVFFGLVWFSLVYKLQTDWLIDWLSDWLRVKKFNRSHFRYKFTNLLKLQKPLTIWVYKLVDFPDTVGLYWTATHQTPRPRPRSRTLRVPSAPAPSHSKSVFFQVRWYISSNTHNFIF